MLNLDKLSNKFQLFMILAIDSVRCQKPKGSKLHNVLLIIEQVAKEGIPLPPDRTICPLCSQMRANPSVVTISGFVFCYSCIFKYVSQVRHLISLHQYLLQAWFFSILLPYLAKIYFLIPRCHFVAMPQYNRCPVTLMPANVDHIRRLFHDM